MKFINEARQLIEQGLTDMKDLVLDLGDAVYEIYTESKYFFINEFSVLFLVYFVVLMLVLLS